MSNIRAFPNYLLIALALILGLAFPIACQAQYFPPGGGGGTPGGANNSVQVNTGGAFAGVAPGSSGNVLTSNGTVWGSSAPAGGGLPTGVTMQPARRQLISQVPTITATTLTSVGWAGPTLTASGAINAQATASNYRALGMTTGAVSGNTATALGAFTELSGSLCKPVFACHFNLTATTLERVWIGFAASDLSGLDSAATVKTAALRYSTSVPDTNFQLVTSDGATQQVTDSGIAADTADHDLVIDYSDATNVKFYIDGVLKGTNSTNVPGGVSSGPLAEITTLTTAAKTLKLGRIFMESQ